MLIFDEYYNLSSNAGPGIADQFASDMNTWTRGVGAVVACCMLLAIGVRASSSILGERDKQTLDGLLTTPLSSDEILFGKWLGSVAGMRWAWVWLGSIWLLGLSTGGLSPLAVPVLMVAWIVYASIAAGIGLWCSVTCRTTLCATIWTIIIMLMAGIGHWVVLSVCCYVPLAISGGVAGQAFLYLFLFKAEFSQTPPAVLTWLAFYADDFRAGLVGRSGELTVYALLGVVSWVFAAMILRSD